MTNTVNDTTSTTWTEQQKIAFRFFGLFFLIQSLPLDGQFFRQLFTIAQDGFHYNDLFNLAHYSPRFVSGPDSFLNWLIVLAIAGVGAAAWTFADRSSPNYNQWYYWVRVVVRYRLAIGIIAYGFIKFFPIQAPYPSLSNLNTAYGDFNRWKLFSISLGIVPNYQSFLGLVEILAGSLLLYQQTATIGAFVIAIFTGNVFMSNLGYEGGEYVYSFYLISLALFIIAYDLRRIVSLLILQKATPPNTFKPRLTEAWQRQVKLAVKSLVVFVFVFLYGFKTKTDAANGLTLYPSTKGLPGAAGVYDVAEFIVNRQPYPYSKTDPTRWQDVIFEKWNTMSVRSNRPVVADTSNITTIPTADDQRLYELEGSAGRHYYSYTIDTIQHTLRLKNRNKNYATDTWTLQYLQPAAKQLVLSGVNSTSDSVYLVLNRIDKKYLVEEAAKTGRRTRLKL